MPVQVARRRANSRRGSRLGRREKQRRTVNFNGELGRCYSWPLGSDEASGGMTNLASFVIASEISFALLKVATPAAATAMIAGLVSQYHSQHRKNITQLPLVT